MAHVLEATNPVGLFVYYTGKSGAEWLSADIREAFEFTSDLGERRMRQFNERTPLTGLIFEKVNIR